MRIELLWFDGCPNHERVRALLREVLAKRGVEAAIEEIDAGDPDIARRVRFAGSPTIRIDGVDVDPGYEDDGDYTVRCRLYVTSVGLRGTPEREWIESAVDLAA